MARISADSCVRAFMSYPVKDFVNGYERNLIPRTEFSENQRKMPKNVLVIEPAIVNRIRLSSILEAGQYSVEAFASCGEAGALPCEPDLVLAASSGEAPASVVRTTRAAIGQCSAPILLLDENPTPLRRLAALRAGAREVLPTKVAEPLLLARLRGLIREGEAERECERRRIAAASFGLAEAPSGFESRATVVIIDPDRSLPKLDLVLGTTLVHRVCLKKSAEALCDTPGDRADAYVVVSGSNTGTLDTLLPELRDRTHSRHAPVLAICPESRPDIATRALALGASDLATETACGEELAYRVDAMLTRKRQRDALRQSDENSYRLAATDPLTGLFNRRYAEAYLGDLMMRSRESLQEFALMLVDLDHFKCVNDRYGHAAGDAVLCEVSQRLRENLRACDLISRHGGEEFLVILPETRPEEAARTAERLRSAVSSTPVQLGKDRQVRVTASIGVAGGTASDQLQPVNSGPVTYRDMPETYSALSLLLEAADSALYRAKEFGRNRVEFSAA